VTLSVGCDVTFKTVISQAVLYWCINKRKFTWYPKCFTLVPAPQNKWARGKRK